MNVRSVDWQKDPLGNHPAAVMPFKFPAVHNGAVNPVSCRNTVIWQLARLALMVQMNNREIGCHRCDIAPQIDERQAGKMGESAVNGLIMLWPLYERGNVLGALQRRLMR